MGTVFEVRSTNDRGVFQARLQNTNHVMSPELNEKFQSLLNAYCAGSATTLKPVVIITGDERTPSAYIENQFRCGE